MCDNEHCDIVEGNQENPDKGNALQQHGKCKCIAVSVFTKSLYDPRCNDISDQGADGRNGHQDGH